MIWLVLGVLLYAGVHLFKRLAPKARKGMGDAAKGLVTAGSLLGVVMMVIGYRMADPDFLWAAPGWAWHLNNLIMVVAVILFAAGMGRNRLRQHYRHPMLTGVILWAVAHLLVNGDVPSLVLFGGIGLWAAAEIVLINRSGQKWVPQQGSAQGDLRWAATAVVMFALFVGVHMLVGPRPFPGGA